MPTEAEPGLEKPWTVRLYFGIFLAVGILFLLVGFGILPPWSEPGTGPPPPRWVFGVVGLLFFLPCLTLLAVSFLRPRQPSATSGAASPFGSILGFLGVIILVGCLAALFNYGVYEIIREIPEVGIWGKAAMMVYLIGIGGGALILDALFVGLLVGAIGTAFERLRY